MSLKSEQLGVTEQRKEGVCMHTIERAPDSFLLQPVVFRQFLSWGPVSIH